MDTKEKILEGTIRVFKKKGLKFTMDDLANELSMSKKTIYKEFPDKESLYFIMVDYCFDKIKASEEEVMEEEELDCLGKFRKILSAMPDGYREIDFRQLYPLKDKYPYIYKKIERRLETGWDNTFALLDECILEGKVRPVDPLIFKTMMEASLERFLENDFLLKNGISYQAALETVVDILLEGIMIR